MIMDRIDNAFFQKLLYPLQTSEATRNSINIAYGAIMLHRMKFRGDPVFQIGIYRCGNNIKSGIIPYRFIADTASDTRREFDNVNLIPITQSLDMERCIVKVECLCNLVSRILDLFYRLFRNVRGG